MARPVTETTLMLILTFGTGIVDAVGYLGLDRVFTGNMTGNVVVLAMGLVGGAGLPVAGPLLALFGFVAGAALGGRLLRGTPGGWNRRVGRIVAADALAIAALALVTAFGPDTSAAHLPVTTLLGIVMGVQAAAARHVGVKDVTTVVVTSTLTGLASDSVLGNGTGSQWRRRGTAVVLLIAGAGCGALLVHVGLWAGLMAAAVVSGVVAGLGRRVDHSGR